GEAGDLKVGAMDLEQHTTVRRQRAFVVVRMRAIGRADLDQLRAGPRHDVGNSKRPADLHQLAARHDRIAAAGKRAEREQYRAGGVVDHHRVGRAGEPDEQGAAPPFVRAASTTARTAFTTSERGCTASNSATPGPARSASIEGS